MKTITIKFIVPDNEIEQVNKDLDRFVNVDLAECALYKFDSHNSNQKEINWYKENNY